MTTDTRPDFAHPRSSLDHNLSVLSVLALERTMKKRGKTEAEILRAVQRGEAYYPFSYCGAWGQRKINAAQKLHDAGEARLIRLLPHDSKPFVHRAVVVPVGYDWDEAQYAIFKVRP